MIEDGLLNADLVPVDRLGRKQPHRLNVLVFAKSINGFADRFKVVPERFYAVTPKVAQVECPCRQAVSAELGALTRHDGCPRIYLWTGQRLLVANSPSPEEVAITS